MPNYVIAMYIMTSYVGVINQRQWLATCWTVGTISGHHIASVQGSSLEHHHLLPHNVLVIITHQ